MKISSFDLTKLVRLLRAKRVKSNGCPEDESPEEPGQGSSRESSLPASRGKTFKQPIQIRAREAR